MNGITILSETTKTPEPIWALILFVVSGVIGLGVGIYTLIFTIRNKKSKFDSISYFPSIFTLIIGFILLFGGIYKLNHNPAYKTYKVVIDESTSFVEFTQKYEVIGQDGLIYEIREKDQK